ncbi:MAG: cupredoxin family copper-binding protein [Parcubacteria group bacterium]|nr:cupredoxin family copper-binding protein [Parcubacteria group bacterium]
MLRDLGDIAPERSVDVFSRAAEARLKAAEARALRGGANETEDIEETLFEYEKYAEFGREISELGQGLRVGETTVEELVERAGQQHLDVLRRVQQQVPFEAQEGIRRALENAEAVRDARPIVPGQNEDLEAARSRLFQREQERAPSQTEDDFDAARFDETRFGKVSPTIPAPVTRELPQTDTVRDEASRLEETPLRILPSSTPIPTPIREQDKVESLPVRSISPTPVTPIPTTSVVPVPSVIEVPAPSVVEVPVRVLATIQGFAFSPASITVKKGTTIVWTNKDSVGHTVTGGGGGPDSRLLGEGESYSFTFNNAGVFNYVCSPHPSMRGTVTVTE